MRIQAGEKHRLQGENMLDQYSRTELIFGKDAMQKIFQSRVAVFGLGGVGGNCAEALARSGVGTLDLVDSDRVTLSNLNRQLFAVRSNIGRYKADAAADRIRDIDPDITVHPRKIFYLPENADQFDFTQYDYIVDCIDTVTAKIDIIVRAAACGVPVISSMGCGNRVDPTRLMITDLYRTSQDPLARVMRTELKKRGIKKLKVLFSTEPAIKPLEGPGVSFLSSGIRRHDAPAGFTSRRSTPGSTAFVPPAAGLMIASEVIRDLAGFDPAGRAKGGQK